MTMIIAGTDTIKLSLSAELEQGDDPIIEGKKLIETVEQIIYSHDPDMEKIHSGEYKHGF